MRDTTQRLLAALLAVFGTAMLLIVAPAGVAHAAAPANCGYPVARCYCPTLMVSTTTPRVGEAITVTGVHFRANARVGLTLLPAPNNETDRGTYRLGSARTDGDGSFSKQVVMPRATTNQGNFIIKPTSGFATSTTCPVDPATRISLSAGGTDQNRQGQPDSNEPGTAFTGLNVLWLVLLAGALVAVGGYANRRGKKTEVRSIHG